MVRLLQDVMVYPVATALGTLGLQTDAAGAGRLLGVLLPLNYARSDAPVGDAADLPARLRPLAAELQAYLAGETETLPWSWLRDEEAEMSEFRLAVSKACYAIPRGQTRRYGEVAASVGKPRGAQAVGQIMATNPWPLLIPCHRVVGSDGLHGFGGGLDMKARLLELEAGDELELY